MLTTTSPLFPRRASEIRGRFPWPPFRAHIADLRAGQTTVVEGLGHREDASVATAMGAMSFDEFVFSHPIDTGSAGTNPAGGKGPHAQHGRTHHPLPLAGEVPR